MERTFRIVLVAVRQMDGVIKKSIFFIPQRQTLGAVRINGVSDVHEMLEEFAGHVFVRRILARQFQ